MTLAEHLSAGGWTEGEAVVLLAAATWTLVLGGWLVARWWRLRRVPGAVERPLGDDDTTPKDSLEEAASLTFCPHGVRLNRDCTRCEDAFRGKHITLDDPDPPGAA